MRHGKKYFTMSLDDGVVQDERFISVLKKYGFTCTFNINTGNLGQVERLPILAFNGNPLIHDTVTEEQIKNGLYDGFEVACHTLRHPMLTTLTEREAEEEIFGDYENILRLTGYAPIGIAYPGMHPNYDERTLKLLRKDGRIAYGRTIDETGDFSLPGDFLQWRPTCQFRDEKLLDYARKFLREEREENLLFFVWGHTYEFDLSLENWERVEELFRLLSEARDKDGERAVQCVTNGAFYRLCSCKK